MNRVTTQNNENGSCAMFLFENKWMAKSFAESAMNATNINLVKIEMAPMKED